jgi:hypothetical protein
MKTHMSDYHSTNSQLNPLFVCMIASQVEWWVLLCLEDWVPWHWLVELSTPRKYPGVV